MINLNLNGMAPNIRDAFKAVQDELNNAQVLSAGLKVYTITLNSAVSEYAIPHALGYVPTDIITSKTDGSSFTWEWQLFTKDNLYITSLGPVVIKCFIGRSVGGVVIE